MRIDFVERQNGPERMLCEAEIVFDGDGPLAGMKLVGISIWTGTDGPTVSFPARSFGAGGERRFFDFLRTTESGSADARRVKAWIVAEYEAARATLSK